MASSDQPKTRITIVARISLPVLLLVVLTILASCATAETATSVPLPTASATAVPPLPPSATPDIDATVQSLVEQTVEANEAFEKAVTAAVSSTREAEPISATPTPIPSPTPTPVPTATSVPPTATPVPTVTSVPPTVVPTSTPTSKIAFTSERFYDGEFGNAQIYVMNPDGSNQIALLNRTGWDAGAFWSPDGSQIVFQSYYSGTDPKSHLIIVAADGSSNRGLTLNKLDNNPSWSPDGTKIAFDSNRFDDRFDETDYGADNRDYEIYVVNTDGSDVTRLTNNAGIHDLMPAWSPDGSKIAFVSLRDGINEIYIMDSDGSNQTRITKNNYDDFDPAWSS